MTKSRYAIVRNSGEIKYPLVIRDLGPWDAFKTVTNDIDNVIKELLEKGELKPKQRLLYYDSEGELDEVLIDEGKFVKFLPGARLYA